MNRQEEVSSTIMDKSIEQFRIKAQKHAHNFLCLDCYDQRCRTDSICPAFITATEDITWELIDRICEGQIN